MFRSLLHLSHVLLYLLLCSCNRGNQGAKNSITASDSLSIVVEEVPLADSIKNMGYPRQPATWKSVQARDSITIGNHTLLFTLVPGHFSSYHEDQLARDSVAGKYSDPYYRAMAVEQYLGDSLFERIGDTLLLKPQQHHHWYLINTDSQKYSLEKYFIEPHLYLIKSFYESGSSYLMINAENGEPTYLWGRPHFSPNGQKMMVINNDQKVQYSANGIQYFEVEKDRWVFQWELGISNWGPAQLHWVSDDSLYIQREYLTPVESEEVYLKDAVRVVLKATAPHPL